MCARDKLFFELIDITTQASSYSLRFSCFHFHFGLSAVHDFLWRNNLALYFFVVHGFFITKRSQQPIFVSLSHKRQFTDRLQSLHKKMTVCARRINQFLSINVFICIFFCSNLRFLLASLSFFLLRFKQITYFHWRDNEKR